MRKLYRPRLDRKIAGVCSGLANYLNIDDTVIRLICIFLLIFTGIIPLTLVYLIAMLVIPEEPV